ncbi:hypothetical protein D9757_004191 [Collybiopsis confluens]|uniref:Uncharacterized protein n=1 Tax=Collybiopsis confluens TaxID=2823264 RepID=A0A8H5HU17_9AGAR|nr:hypothetical protein D9757_004191 [Collybiopsis confluens]
MEGWLPRSVFFLSLLLSPTFIATTSQLDMDLDPPPVNGKPPSPSPPPTTSSALASLLSTALAQVESLKDKLKREKKRADHFEVLASDYKDLLGQTSPDKKDSEEKTGEDSRPVTDPSISNQLAKATEQIKHLRELVSAAEQVRDEEMARRIAITDLWAQLNQYLDRLELAGRDVRAGFDRIVKHDGGVMRDHTAMFRDIPQLSEGDLMRVDRTYNVDGILQPLLPYSSRKHDYPRHGTRRPRSGSMDAYGYGLGPNSKRVRYQEEPGHHHQSASGMSPTYYPPSHPPHPPPPGSNSLSPTTATNHVQQHQNNILQSMPFAQGQPQSAPLAAPSSSSGSGSRHRDRRHGDTAAMHPPDHHLYPPPGYEHPYRSQEYRDDRKRRRRSRSYSRGRSPSRGSEASMDVDEMLLATATGDEQHPQPNGLGPSPQLVISGRPGIVYDPREGSQFVHQVPPPSVSPHQQHLTTNPSSHHLGGPPPPRYPQPSPGPVSGRLSPAVNPASRPGSSRRGREQLRTDPPLRDDLVGDRRDSRAPDGSGLIAAAGQVQYQTHVFAPVQTGAPVKKGKFNNTGGNASHTNVAEENYSNPPANNPAPVAATNSTSSLPLTSVNLAPATSPYPPTNEQGQRICRQCGMPGRYKEGKCVEKWGPGPMGPGTVCDRQVVFSENIKPCRKKMKRVERRGTIEQAQMLAAQQASNRSQPSIGNGGSFTFSGVPREGSSAKLSRTDTVLVDSSGRHFDETAVSSIRSTSNSRTVTSPPFAKSNKLSSGSRPTSKAASRAGSIVDGSKGSRRSSPLPSSRLTLSSSVPVLNPSRAHAASTSSVQSNGSGSTADIDADADGDADGDLDDPEAEVEGDIAALVDQAASSPPISRVGPKHRGNNNNEDEEDADVDSAVLATVDDDPDDYDSPATTNALKKQQSTTRVGNGSNKSALDVHSRLSPSSVDGDAELDILEAVDAAEANSAASSSGLKTEDP